jgi:hypothetical protein
LGDASNPNQRFRKDGRLLFDLGAAVVEVDGARMTRFRFLFFQFLALESIL